MQGFSRRDVLLILAALQDAAEWQDSLSDAHHCSLSPWHRSRENTAWARKADRQRARYLKLAVRIKEEATKGASS
jgi:hypothetical protein